jgi:hypothetical protein
VAKVLALVSFGKMALRKAEQTVRTDARGERMIDDLPAARYVTQLSKQTLELLELIEQLPEGSKEREELLFVRGRKIIERVGKLLARELRDVRAREARAAEERARLEEASKRVLELAI